jgi:hypothetical protein
MIRLTSPGGQPVLLREDEITAVFDTGPNRTVSLRFGAYRQFSVTETIEEIQAKLDPEPTHDEPTNDDDEPTNELQRCTSCRHFVENHTENGCKITGCSCAKTPPTEPEPPKYRIDMGNWTTSLQVFDNQGRPVVTINPDGTVEVFTAIDAAAAQFWTAVANYARDTGYIGK